MLAISAVFGLWLTWIAAGMCGAGIGGIVLRERRAERRLRMGEGEDLMGAFAPVPTAELAALAALYLWASRRPARWDPLRTASFLAGLAAVAVALGPLDSLADDGLSGHMVQHLVLIFVAPPLLLGRLSRQARPRDAPGPMPAARLSVWRAACRLRLAQPARASRSPDSR